MDLIYDENDAQQQRAVSSQRWSSRHVDLVRIVAASQSPLQWTTEMPLHVREVLSAALSFEPARS